MKKIILSLALLMMSLYAETPLYYQGEVMMVSQGGAYTYLEIKEKTEKTFFVVVSQADVKVGDYVRFQKELVTQNFKSKALDRTFKELMFASHLEQKIE